MKTSRHMENEDTPTPVTPRFGTNSSSIRRSTENENVRVPTRMASVAFSRRSRYQRRMMRAENVPIAICTTRTVTVTTKPVSAAVAQRSRTARRSPSMARTPTATASRLARPRKKQHAKNPAPRTAPASGMTQKLSSMLPRRRNLLAQVITRAPGRDLLSPRR